ncbi:hypothetical protein P3X46_013780 [Hevea brasiliensis]|uniref:Homeobox domain-containing protein n=1 Tax=Hevea brasiliensis TaxID=3981 RepID=A0ABQ9M4K0_HEVBR|nr:homeobox protein HAT3.1 [Hevea brasiliensis]XP_021646972.2 homeobox protein HAT3.1 [Hevea brasiliensis]XP_058007434.1 homeobox protein HAT3.1 [Hevea brasiliensis]XP_058007435.1 homeobox protein HAT3.1 [Hevea brasiliensis]KAJ9175202.1 hypothetical protein P3X46_013780 [Hevea brasiliensis]KAJ9175203.1 hypothetical protein P3X46_013780 [Hevea brasiliensis]
MFKAKRMGISPSQVSCHTKSYSCPKQSTSEETPEYGAECKHTEISEQKHQIMSETVQTEPGDTNTVVSQSGASEALQQSSDDAMKNSLTENLEAPSEDACKSSLTDKSLGPKPTAIDQKLEFVSEDTCNGPSKEQYSLGSGIIQNHNALSTITVNENLQLLSEDAAKNSLTNDLELPHEDARESSQVGKSPCPHQSMPEQTLEFSSDSACCEPSVERRKACLDIVKGELLKISTPLSSCTATRHFEPPPALVAKSSIICLGLPRVSEINVPATEKLRPSHDDMDKHSNLEQSETPSKDTVSNSSRVGWRVKRTAKSRKKYILRSLVRSDRVLQSRSQEKPKASDSSANLANVSSKKEKTRQKKKKRQGMRIEADEYSKIRKHLRYLLNRMSYEQSLIAAYSAEGWKGLSLEKLKPEKELQRATSEIFRRKLKIRDLFQRIDSLCVEGKLPESLFDSEGQISSEDIFCAKCGSKDLTVDNDIILCDGACDRGFHQFCLVPPLLKEDIPPDDEGWLCPGCDCKVDCIELLNDCQGTNISISDSWEKVFPEAATAGQNPDQNFGLPSDDSDDNDYDPDGPEIDEKSQGDESSSDESDFTSVSDELEASPGDKQNLGLSSDDSEDDDYDPDGPDLDENVQEESSSSDFTSDSDDLATSLHNKELSGEHENRVSIVLQGDIIREGSKHSGKKKQYSELLSILEPSPSQDGSAAISGRRNVERLNYKKLYDETYGNVSSDSSDDEDFTDTVGPRKRRRSTEVAPASVNGDASVTKTGKQDLEGTEYAPKRSCLQSNCENTSISPAKSQEGSSPSSFCGRTVKRSVYRRLGEAVTQRLYKCFKENQYPDRVTKESLAKELDITFRQVSKWFENARWSFNHSSSMDALVRKTSEKDSPLPKTNSKPLERGHETVGGDATSNGAQSEKSPKIGNATAESNMGDARDAKLGSQEGSKRKSKILKSRKRKNISGQISSGTDSMTEETEKLPANLPKAQETQASGRVTRSKSVA